MAEARGDKPWAQEFRATIAGITVPVRTAGASKIAAKAPLRSGASRTQIFFCYPLL
jgi:hypothetical protein